MPAPKGNQYWKLGEQKGRPKKYTPNTLLVKAYEYFQWCEDNPLYEQKAFGTGITLKLPLMRAFTKSGLCLYLDISHETFLKYSRQKEFVEVTTRISDIIYTQKFEGASAGLLNANIIARDLGLRENIEHSGEIKGSAIVVNNKKDKTNLEKLGD
jgi:hypothetical protein